MGKKWKQWQTWFGGVQKSLWIAAMKLKDACSLKKPYENLDRVLKIRDISLLTKVHIIKAIVFPVVMYGCESWTIKKAEQLRTDAFELWYWRRCLWVPWTARRSNQYPKGNQSWIFIGRTDAEVEAPIFWPHHTQCVHPAGIKPTAPLQPCVGSTESLTFTGPQGRLL